MRRYAQEHSDLVLWKHVELYVTDETRGIGAEGRSALRELARRACTAGLARSARPLALSDEPTSWA
jgi:predicted solute-binding protein